MSQGTMIREPKYGGGAHPKYRSCRVLVSQIPRTEVWRGCTPKVSEFEGSSEPSPVRFVGGGAHPRTDLEGGSVPKNSYIFSPSHTVYMVWFVVQLVE